MLQSSGGECKHSSSSSERELLLFAIVHHPHLGACKSDVNFCATRAADGTEKKDKWVEQNMQWKTKGVICVSKRCLRNSQYIQLKSILQWTKKSARSANSSEIFIDAVDAAFFPLYYKKILLFHLFFSNKLF